MVTEAVVVLIGADAVHAVDARQRAAHLGDDPVAEVVEVVGLDRKAVAQQRGVDTDGELLALLPGQAGIAQPRDGVHVGLVGVGRADPLVARGVGAELDARAFRVVVFVEVLRAERTVADRAGLPAYLEVVDPFHVPHESLFGYDPAQTQRGKYLEAFAGGEHRRSGVVHDGLEEVFAAVSVVEGADERHHPFADRVARALDRFQPPGRRSPDAVVVVPVVVAQPFVQVESLMGPFAHARFAGDLRSLVRSLDGLFRGGVVDDGRVVGVLADAVHVEEVQPHVGLEFEPFDQRVQVVGERGVDHSRAAAFGREAVLGQRCVGIVLVDRADAVDLVARLLVVRDDQRECDRGDRGDLAERAFELRGRGVAVAVAGLAAETDPSAESQVDQEVLRDGRFEIGADVHPVEIGLAAHLVDVALAGIADVGAVLEFLGASVDGDVGFVIGLRVLEHHRPVIDVRIGQVVGVLAGVVLDRLVRVGREIAAVDARLVLQPGVFDAVDPLGEAVHDAHAAFEAHADRPSVSPSPAGGDVEHAVGCARAQQRLVGDVADESHAFDLLGVELQLGDVDRHAVHDVFGRHAAGVDRRAARFRGVEHAGRSRQLADGESRDDARERVAEIVGRVFVDVVFVVGRRVARGGRLVQGAGVGQFERLIDAQGPPGPDRGVCGDPFGGQHRSFGTLPAALRGARGRCGRQQEHRAGQEYVAVSHGFIFGLRFYQSSLLTKFFILLASAAGKGR